MTKKNPNTKPKFVTVARYLTDYALHCGYMEVNENYNAMGQTIRIALFKECDYYHVRVIDKDMWPNQVASWDSHEKLVEARKDFQRQLRIYDQVRQIPKSPTNEEGITR